MPATAASVNGIAAIKAFASTQLADRTMLWDSSTRNAAQLYVYNGTSTATADDNLILLPSDGIGRWEKNVPASSGGGGGGVTVDSSIVASIPSPTTGPRFPALRPSITPSSIGQTIFVYRQYTGTIFNGLQSIGMIVTRSGYFTAIGLTAADWQTDRSGVVDVEYTTENGNPIQNNPLMGVSGELRVEADYAGQRVITRAATTLIAFQDAPRYSQIVTYDTGLPVAGSTTTWWEWF